MLGVWTAALSIWSLWPVWPLAVVAFVAKQPRARCRAATRRVRTRNLGLVRERGIAHASAHGPRLTIFTANIYDGNRHIATDHADIIRSHADLVFLQELRPKHLQKLEAAARSLRTRTT